MLKLRCRADFSEESFRPDHRAELGAKQLQRNLSIMTEIFGEINSCHAAGPDLITDFVARFQGGGQPRNWVVHERNIQLPARRREKNYGLRAGSSAFKAVHRQARALQVGRDRIPPEIFLLTDIRDIAS